MSEFSLFGKGLYSTREAHQLTDVPIWSIRRWSQGYRYRYKGLSFFSEPAIATDINRIDGQIVLSFADLMELRVINQFLEKGVSWRTLRIASHRAVEILKTKHPFSSKSFRTDGRHVLLDLADAYSDQILLNLLNDQFEMKKLLVQYLYEQIDYDGEKPERWWPLGREKQVVIDPARSFGAPILAKQGIQTRILKKAFDAEASIEFVAHWFEIESSIVKDAIEFENRIAA